MKAKTLIIIIYLFFTLMITVSCDTQKWEYKRFEKYVGEYSLKTDFFALQDVCKEMKGILGEEYEEYLKHMKLSGCGKIVKVDKYIYGDVSQLHVGGYTSIWFFDLKNGEMFVFWINDAIRNSTIEIFGNKPIPKKILEIVREEMTISWGHVAVFKINGSRIEIKKKET